MRRPGCHPIAPCPRQRRQDRCNVQSKAVSNLKKKYPLAHTAQAPIAIIFESIQASLLAQAEQSGRGHHCPPANYRSLRPIFLVIARRQRQRGNPSPTRPLRGTERRSHPAAAVASGATLDRHAALAMTTPPTPSLRAKRGNPALAQLHAVAQRVLSLPKPPYLSEEQQVRIFNRLTAA